MSIISIRAALETALAAISTDIDVVWENITYTPTLGTPYLKVFLLPARPDDITMGAGYRRESGIFQVNLMYPDQNGTGDCAVRAELIKSTFKRGTSFSAGGITVNITSTPEIVGGTLDGENYIQPVRIYYWANIFS